MTDHTTNVFKWNHNPSSADIGEEYGGSARECIAFMRSGGDSDTLEPAMVGVPAEDLPDGHNY